MRKFYSHSRISCFEQCPLKFKFRYIDKIFPDIEKSIEAHLGGAVHDALEWLYLEVRDGRVPAIDDVMVKYSEAWKKDFSPNLIIVKQEFTAKDYFNKGIKFLLDYYTRHQPFQDGTLELEKEIRIRLDENGNYMIRGFIDRLAKNPETGELEIHDYKTGNSLPSQEKIDTDRQLALYALAIKELFGHENEVCLVWHYLAHDKKICSRRTNQQLQELKHNTLEQIKKIESATEFPHNKGILCDWCEYKQMCPAWNTSEDKIEINKPIKVDTSRYPTISKYIKD